MITFSDTPSRKVLRPTGSTGNAFTVCIRTENQNKTSFSPFGQHESYVLIELALGDRRYCFTDVPPHRIVSSALFSSPKSAIRQKHMQSMRINLTE